MWSCTICPLKFSSRVQLTLHLNGSHSKDWIRPFVCGQEGCLKRFDTVELWKRHLRYHIDICETTSTAALPNAPEINGPIPTTETSRNQADSFQEDEISSLEEAKTDDIHGLEPVKWAGVRFVSEMRACSSTTVSACEKAVAGCNDVVESVVEVLRSQILQRFQDKLSPDEQAELQEMSDAVSRPLDFLSSDAKQKSYFSSMPTFVSPVRFTYGPPKYLTTVNSSGEPFQKALYDSWMYVPIHTTLKVLFSQPDVFQSLKIVPPENGGIIADFVDGSIFCSENELLRNPTKAAVALEIYYDDIEVANALGSKATVHKIGVFYMTAKNLPSFYSKSMAHIHLVALAYTQDLKTYGYNSVLEKIAEDISILETDGVELKVIGHTHRLYATLAIVNGDNLGRHAILGLFESFRARFFCEGCNCSQKDLQVKFCEDEFHRRDQLSYDVQVEKVLADRKNAPLYGISGFCALNNTTYWHVTKNRVGDLMHDFLEGVGPFEVKLVLSALVSEKLFSLEDLNARISGFLYGKTDVTSRPSAIPNADPSDHSLKQKAFQFFCLFRLLPLFIGEFIPNGNRYWAFYLDLRRCADYLFAQKWTSGMAAQWKEMWRSHCCMFKKLFPAFNLIPKHHFLGHYGSFALATGPPYKNMVASHEMKMNFMKRLAHIMCNFRNVPYTLAWKMQYFANNVLLSGASIKDRTDFLHAENVPLNLLDFSLIISETLQVSVDCNVISATSFEMRGQIYHQGCVLVLERIDNDPLFGIMQFGVCVSKTEPLYVAVSLLKTLYFDEHFWAYVVRKTGITEVRSVNNLCDYHPLDLYDAINVQEYLVPQWQERFSIYVDIESLDSATDGTFLRILIPNPEEPENVVAESSVSLQNTDASGDVSLTDPVQISVVIDGEEEAVGMEQSSSPSANLKNVPKEKERFLYKGVKPFDVKKILADDRLNRGAELLEEKNFNGNLPITELLKRKHKLQRILANWLMENCSKCLTWLSTSYCMLHTLTVLFSKDYPNYMEMAKMVHSACLVFPFLLSSDKNLHLGWEDWYDPIIRNGPFYQCIAQRRKTLHKQRSYNWKNGSHKRGAKESSSTEVDIGSDDEKEQDEELGKLKAKMARLEPNIPNFLKVIEEGMKKTQVKRQQWIKSESPSLTEIFKEYPKFISDATWSLINDEFEYVISQTNIRPEELDFGTTWEKYAPLVVKEALSRQDKVNGMKDRLENCDIYTVDDLTNASTGDVSLAALMCLPYLMPATAGRNGKVSSATAQTYLLHVTKGSLSNESAVTAAKRTKDLKQPFLLLKSKSGEYTDVIECFVVCDSSCLKVSGNVTVALELLYKVFWCFNIEYPSPLNVFYDFLDIIFGLQTTGPAVGRKRKYNSTQSRMLADRLREQLND